MIQLDYRLRLPDKQEMVAPGGRLRADCDLYICKDLKKGAPLGHGEEKECKFPTPFPSCRTVRLQPLSARKITIQVSVDGKFVADGDKTRVSIPEIACLSLKEEGYQSHTMLSSTPASFQFESESLSAPHRNSRDSRRERIGRHIALHLSLKLPSDIPGSYMGRFAGFLYAMHVTVKDATGTAIDSLTKPFFVTTSTPAALSTGKMASGMSISDVPFGQKIDPVDIVVKYQREMKEEEDDVPGGEHKGHSIPESSGNSGSSSRKSKNSSGSASVAAASGRSSTRPAWISTEIDEWWKKKGVPEKRLEHNKKTNTGDGPTTKTISSASSSVSPRNEKKDKRGESAPLMAFSESSRDLRFQRHFNIQHAGQKAMRVSLNKSRYAPGDTIHGRLLFFPEGRVHVLRVAVKLQSCEMSGKSRACKDFGPLHAFSADMLQTTFSISVPSTAPASFRTSLLSLNWALRFRVLLVLLPVVAPPEEEGEEDRGDGSRDDERRAVQKLDPEVLTMGIPISVIHESD